MKFFDEISRDRLFHDVFIDEIQTINQVGDFDNLFVVFMTIVITLFDVGSDGGMIPLDTCRGNSFYCMKQILKLQKDTLVRGIFKRSIFEMFQLQNGFSEVGIKLRGRCINHKIIL